ncbi:MAG TPA: DNA repair exonuclease [Myxococcota bacterium]|nr:DNA repair exonuclease [Myxococcota bacterium]
MTLNLLCAADIHLGRRTSRLPRDVDADDCSPAAAWFRLVDKAVELTVDGVLLAGDLVDEDNQYFEGRGKLQRGVSKLVEHGIQVIAVAGNHDHDVLVRLARDIAGFKLLGAGGQWEEYGIEKDGRVALRLHGWSFPARHFREDPLAYYPFNRDTETPSLGLLHCDLNASGSIYAPVSEAELSTTPEAAWVLGHIHHPGLAPQGSPLIFYCGSPQGLDPSESGWHGAWLLRVEESGVVERERVQVSGMRWEVCQADLSLASDRPSFEECLAAALASRIDELGSELDYLRAVGLRVRLTGASEVHGKLLQLLANIEIEDLATEREGLTTFVEKIEDRTRPRLDLESLSRGGSPLAILARDIALLESRQPRAAYQTLVAEAGSQIERRVRDGIQFAQVHDEISLDEDNVRELLLRTGFRALDMLLATRAAQEKTK